MSTAQPRPRSRFAEWAVLASAVMALGLCAQHASMRGPDTLRIESWWLYTGGAIVALGFGLTIVPRTRLGVAATVGLAGFAVGMAGQYNAPTGPFALVAGLYVVLAQYALRHADPTREPPSFSQRRGLLPVLAVAAALTGLFAFVLPRAHRAVERAVSGAFYRYADRSGFGDRLELEAIDGLAQSQRVVLRVDGTEPYALRGVVYDQYRRGHWRSTRTGALGAGEATPPPSVPAPLPTRGFFTERRVAGTPSTYFVSLGNVAHALAQNPGLRVDRYGVLHPPAGLAAEQITARFDRAQPSDTVRGRATPEGPDERDLQVPDALYEPLRALALEWIGGAHDAGTVMTRLETRLRASYRYSLRVPSSGNRDPLLAFLFEHRRGHCEYFASALALLGRSVGVPTRVVAGYRTGDYNPLTRSFLVRDRHAHSWVEAHVDERGWRTFDATPFADEAPMVQRTLPWGSAAWDWLVTRVTRLVQWVRRRPPSDALYVALVLAAGFALNRLRKRSRDDVDPLTKFERAAAEPTHASYDALCRALEARGLARGPAETLERYAARVEADPALRDEGPRERSLGHEVAALLRAYASLRYGRVGDESALDGELARCARSLASRATRGVPRDATP